MGTLLLIALIVGGVVFAINRSGQQRRKKKQEEELGDAIAEARRWNERLGSQVLTLAGTDAASTQAIADASERYNAAASEIASATTVQQAKLARESALEGLYYMNAAREIMGLPAGPKLPPLEGQRQAGQVSETRTIEFEGREVTASPTATPETPNYYPGGTVAGRPVPAGWYSEPWWASALRTGIWAAASVTMFSMLFSGMAYVPTAAAFESGIPEGGTDLGELGTDSGDIDAGAGGEEGGFFDNLFGDGGFFGGDGGDFGGFDL